ncbi:hypothetical protein C1H46_011848 [Malus baccata]|uniref:Uncharacterized protein n=1 Tax=Malus baccata TaxID=106549 RepID=A0A540MUV7_MALBA|nr:hypothetical protein C1H46_011848 [Malus baccata]
MWSPIESSASRTATPVPCANGSSLSLYSNTIAVKRRPKQMQQPRYDPLLPLTQLPNNGVKGARRASTGRSFKTTTGQKQPAARNKGWRKQTRRKWQSLKQQGEKNKTLKCSRSPDL